MANFQNSASDSFLKSPRDTNRCSWTRSELISPECTQTLENKRRPWGGNSVRGQGFCVHSRDFGPDYREHCQKDGITGTVKFHLQKTLNLKDDCHRTVISNNIPFYPWLKKWPATIRVWILSQVKSNVTCYFFKNCQWQVQIVTGELFKNSYLLLTW